MKKEALSTYYHNKLPKLENGGKPCPKNHVRVNGKCISIYSDEYRKLYNQGLQPVQTESGVEYYTSRDRIGKNEKGNIVSMMPVTVSKSILPNPPADNARIAARPLLGLTGRSKSKPSAIGQFFQDLKGTYLNPYNWGVSDYSEYKTKDEAYSAAKKAGESEFLWKGTRYTTEYAGTPRQEIGRYGANGRPVNVKDYENLVQTNVYPPLHRNYVPGHISSSFPAIEETVDYGPYGNVNAYIGVPDDGAQAYYSFGVDPNRFRKVSSNLPTDAESSRWNLITNNCADNVCDAFGIPRAGRISNFVPQGTPPLTTPGSAMAQIKRKYPTINVTGRTFNDYADDPLHTAWPDEVLNKADYILGIASSPDLIEQGISKWYIQDIQRALSEVGYSLPKSKLKDYSNRFDGIFGEETKAALEDWKRKNSRRRKDGGNALQKYYDKNISKYKKGGVFKFQNGGLNGCPPGWVRDANGDCVQDPEARRALARKAVEIARQRIKEDRYYDVPEDLKRSSEAQGEGAYGCVGGVCSVYTDAGIMSKPNWSNTDFSLHAREYGFPNKGYGLDQLRHLEPGDMIQYYSIGSKNMNKAYPHHAQLFLGVNQDTGKYEFFDNYAKSMRSYTKKEMEDYFNPENEELGREFAKVYKVNPYTPPPAVINPLAQAALLARKEFIKDQVANNTAYRYGINAKNLNNPYGAQAYDLQDNEVVNKFLQLANDEDFINRMVEDFAVSKSDIHDSLLNVFGELGQESNFGQPRKLTKSWMENIAEKGNVFHGTPVIKSWRSQSPNEISVGPGQIKFKYISQDLRDKFNINSPKDLYDSNKVIPLMLAQDIQNKRTIKKWKKEGKIKSYFGVDDIPDDQIGRYSPYLRNSYYSIASRKRTDDGKMVSNVDPNTGELIEKWEVGKGSYPSKVGNFWMNLLSRKNITPYSGPLYELQEDSKEESVQNLLDVIESYTSGYRSWDDFKDLNYPKPLIIKSQGRRRPVRGGIRYAEELNQNPNIINEEVLTNPLRKHGGLAKFGPGGITKFQNGGEPCPEGFVRVNGKCVEIEIANAAKQAEDYITGWYNSPKYKQRFQESLSPGEEYMVSGRERRLAAIPNIEWVNSGLANYLAKTNPTAEEDLQIKLNLAAHTPEALQEQSLVQSGVHELDHIVNMGGRYIPKKTRQFISSIRPKSFEETPIYKKEIQPHMKMRKDFFDKILGGSGKWVNKEEVNKILRNRNVQENWFSEPSPDNPSPDFYEALNYKFNYYNPAFNNKTETISFWNKIRQDAKELGIYDPYTEDFDKEKFDKFLQIGNTPKTRDFRKLIDWYGNPDIIIEGMNKIVKTGKDNLSTAQDGGVNNCPQGECFDETLGQCVPCDQITQELSPVVIQSSSANGTTYAHRPRGNEEMYMLKRTHIPYTSNRDIRRNIQAPVSPRQVNFLSNYAGATGEPTAEGFVYPTQVPFEGAKHWNIDRFIIDPHFGQKYDELKNLETTKEQARANALADMYKYYMLQYPNKKGKAFRKAKRFVRNEIDPRISGPFYDYFVNRDFPVSFPGIESFADANRLEQLYQVNAVPAQADVDRLKDISIDYFRNYKKMSKKEAENYWKEWERGAAQFPAGDYPSGFPPVEKGVAPAGDVQLIKQKKGGLKKYQKGGVYDVDDTQIQDLINQGYKIKFV